MHPFVSTNARATTNNNILKVICHFLVSMKYVIPVWNYLWWYYTKVILPITRLRRFLALTLQESCFTESGSLFRSVPRSCHYILTPREDSVRIPPHRSTDVVNQAQSTPEIIKHSLLATSPNIFWVLWSLYTTLTTFQNWDRIVVTHFHTYPALTKTRDFVLNLPLPLCQTATLTISPSHPAISVFCSSICNQFLTSELCTYNI